MVMDKNEYKILSSMDLVLMEFPEDRFCIQDILPKGLVILSGDIMEPARSLAMDMSLRVVKGEKLWKMDSKQGSVLYMIHQHALACTRNMVLDMTDRVPDELYIGVMSEDSLKLALTGVRSFVREHGNAAVVVIEINAPMEQYEDAIFVSGDTLRQYIALREFALENNISIVVVLSSAYLQTVHSKVENENMVCITDKADGHIDMCMLDSENTQAIIRVDDPLMAPRLWSIEFDVRHQRWVEENASDRL